MFQGCWCCGSLDSAYMEHCLTCQINVCDDEACDTLHKRVHADVVWNRNLDTLLEGYNATAR